MKRCILLLLFCPAVACAVAAAVLAPILAGPTDASAQAGFERITSYNADIEIQPDGSIMVTEQIAYDFGVEQRHGIFRDIPVRFRYNGSYDRIYGLDVWSVQSPDAPGQYTVDSNGSSVRIKIGDPDQTITGKHSYTITYVVTGGLNGFADHDELYWNAVGNQWDVPIDRASVQVAAPAAVSRAACFAGPLGSANSCRQARITDEVARFTQARLGPYEGLTVVVAIPKGAVAPPHPVLRERWALQRAFALTPVSVGASGGLLAVLVIAGAVVLARSRRRSQPAFYPGGGSMAPTDEVPPQPEDDLPPMESAPPEDIRPGQAGTLLDGVANPRDVTGTIVDLAVRGYLRIEDVAPPAPVARPDWRLVRLRKAGGLLDYEQILLKGVFADTENGGEASIQLSKLGPDFSRALKWAQDALYADVARRGWFTTRPDKVRRRWLAVRVVLFVIGAAALVTAAAYSHLALVPIPLALAGLVLIGGARWMPVRTAKGTELARRLAGFRSFIQTEAAAQASSAERHDVLYDYLPYAIVFGCTEQWADVTASVAAADRPPSWFQTSRPFSPAGLSLPPNRYFSPMHNFATAANSWIESSASSSGTSGFSGGGGYSGGGGGGGSW